MSVRVTVTTHACPFSHRARQRLPAGITESATLPEEPTDYSGLGEPTTDWQHDGTARERQFCHRDHAARMDHLFIVRIVREG